MYRTAAPVLEPAPARTAGALPLRLRRVARREFAGGATTTDTPFLHRYYADLAASHGVEHHPDVLAADSGTTFCAMAGAVVADVTAPGMPVDLVVVAHVLPDLDPRFSPGALLAGTVPGAPLVFALSGPDGAVAVTALRVVGAYARRHAYRRAVVVLVDQATLPYRTGAEPAGDAAVALLLEDGPGAEVTVGRAPDHPTGDRATVLRLDEPGGYPATGAWAGLDLAGHTVLVHRRLGDSGYCSVLGS